MQIETLKHEAEFYKAVHALEKEYTSRFSKLNIARNEIVNAKTEPSAEDTKFPLFSDAEEELAVCLLIV